MLSSPTRTSIVTVEADVDASPAAPATAVPGPFPAVPADVAGGWTLCWSLVEHAQFRQGFEDCGSVPSDETYRVPRERERA